MIGAYVLIVTLDRNTTIGVGALGEIDFAAGAYAYVGSAMSGIEQRVARHLRSDKRAHWHIDHLLSHAEVANVLQIPSRDRVECEIVCALGHELPTVCGFGCSDCRCHSHLFMHPDAERLSEIVRGTVAELHLTSVETTPQRREPGHSRRSV